MKLKTLETRYGKDGISGDPHEWMLRTYTPVARLEVATLRRGGEPAVNVSARAYVNDGRWVVDCPFCNSAQLASVGDRRFLCVGEGADGTRHGCANAEVNGYPVPVTWPSDREIARAEKLLLVRPVENRNWSPDHETIAELKRANREHDLPAGDS